MSRAAKMSESFSAARAGSRSGNLCTVAVLDSKVPMVEIDSSGGAVRAVHSCSDFRMILARLMPVTTVTTLTWDFFWLSLA